MRWAGRLGHVAPFWEGGAGLGTLPAGGVVRPVGLDRFTQTSAGDGVLGNPSRSLLLQDSGGGLVLGPQS